MIASVLGIASVVVACVAFLALVVHGRIAWAVLLTILAIVLGLASVAMPPPILWLYLLQGALAFATGRVVSKAIDALIDVGRDRLAITLGATFVASAAASLVVAIVGGR